jgi:drug/metabolite transporter (DMT)-like permease
MYLLLAVSMLACLLGTILKKQWSRQYPENAFMLHLFNAAISIVSAASLWALTGFQRMQISRFTLLLGILFGVVTALSNYYKMQSLSCGPMHITLLITTSSMIIPTLSGVFFGECFSVYKLILVFVLIFFIYLSLEKKNSTEINKKWLIFCALAFVLQGSIGVLQKIHQSSEHKGEIGGFLFVALICSIVYSHCRAKKGFKALGFNKKLFIFAPICGLCTFLMNFLNLKLSGLLPSQLFFPVVNGSAIILSSVMSVIIFKEKLTKRQIMGLCGGILSLISICLVK